MLSSRDATRSDKPFWRSRLTAIAVAAVLGVAACVSLVSPKGGAGNVPVVRGSYKNGRDQIVRIALATAAREGPTVAPDQGQLIVRPESGPFVLWNGKRYRGELVISSTDSGLLVVNRLPMDDYLRGVVPLEIGNRTSAEMAAVQAQAVAARTYAYKHLSDTRPFDMYATVQDQVYGGVDAEKPLSDTAIATTSDVVVLYNGQPITTPYHSTCGGSTAGVSEVWYDQPDQPYLRPVSDRIPGTKNYYCDPSPRFSWTQAYDAAGLKAVMEKYLASYTNAPKANLGRITDVREQGRTPSGRVAALTVQTESGSYTLRGNDIRFVLRDPKGAILNSTLISLSTATSGGEVSSLTLNGRGYGHGIGMCQWGAIGRARAGQDYRTILETYYPGTTIGRIAG
ncbi:MAG TPA: SpoIID/LytB domain-containing protein [Gemmatimonadaceae bacterium]|nr:SpoIID/LytB domain-containing protein [Gemmatimonadaceae bacterium]